MKKIVVSALLLAVSVVSFSQKKPLDHTVYDSWQSLGERLISSDGKYIVYTIILQEGDGKLLVQTPDGAYKKEIPRGYNATITKDNRFLVCKIKPLFKETREARIKKKKPEDMPKDSLAILQFDNDSLFKKAGIKNYQTPEKAPGWVAYLFEKGFPEQPKDKMQTDSITRLNGITMMADSLVHVADSLRNKAAEAKIKGLSVLQPLKKDIKKPNEEPVEEGTALVLRNLQTGEEKKYELVSDYLFSKNGKKLVLETTKRKNDSSSKGLVLLLDTYNYRVDTVMKGINEGKNFAFDEDATQLAFVAERDSAKKALQRFFKLWYYTPGMDSAKLRVDRNTKGLIKNWTVSENYKLDFSKDGSRLFIGVAPVRPLKDTTLPDFEKSNVDIWNYKSDDLQTFLLKHLEEDMKKSYLAVIEKNKDEILQIENEKFVDGEITKQGDGNVFYIYTDSGKRVSSQWLGYFLYDIYAFDMKTGQKSLIIQDFRGITYPSYTGKYLLLYETGKKGYSVYNSETKELHKVATDVKTPFYDEQNDHPDDPGPYGISGWEKNDNHIYINDRYDIWKVDPEGKEKSTIVSPPLGRAAKISSVYIKMNREDKYIDTAKNVYLSLVSEKTKTASIVKTRFTGQPGSTELIAADTNYLLNRFLKADSTEVFMYSKEDFSSSPNLYVTSIAIDSALQSGKPLGPGRHAGGLLSIQLSHTNPQQSQYLWGSSELFTWKAYTGKKTEGILYKPENFDARKKYPMIVYYYERNNSILHYYLPPSPTPSALNIPFFVSRGYVVFVPDIWYRNGHPGKSAYDYVVSGTRALIKMGFIDSTKIGLQGQSWGGYQTAILITQTNLYAAAWAGAPVVNMFSAYGGIHWESGINRQAQYEKGQSRIGASIWDRPDLYIENSPLFHLQKVRTPLVIMSNDADGAVPWYQGIEFFTAMRRLNKPVWLLDYNGEEHNLVERRNRKDIQIREQQFFDWLLKGDKPPVWITDGVPATLKGIDWGLEIKK